MSDLVKEAFSVANAMPDGIEPRGLILRLATALEGSRTFANPAYPVDVRNPLLIHWRGRAWALIDGNEPLREAESEIPVDGNPPTPATDAINAKLRPYICPACVAIFDTVMDDVQSIERDLYRALLTMARLREGNAL